MRLPIFCILITFFFIITGCDKDKSDQQGLYPLKTGNSWTYKNIMTYRNASPRNTPLPPDDSLQIIEVIEKEVQLENGETAFEKNAQEFHNDEFINSMKTYYQEKGDGLFLVATGYRMFNKDQSISMTLGNQNFKSMAKLKRYLKIETSIYQSKSDSIEILNPPQQIFRYPLKEGLTWVYVDEGDLKIEKTVVGKEDLTTPAGTFDCWQIRWKYYFKGFPNNDVLMIEYLSEEGIAGQLFSFDHIQLSGGDNPVYADYKENILLDGFDLLQSFINPVNSSPISGYNH